MYRERERETLHVSVYRTLVSNVWTSNVLESAVPVLAPAAAAAAAAAAAPNRNALLQWCAVSSYIRVGSQEFRSQAFGISITSSMHRCCYRFNNLRFTNSQKQCLKY